ncbi:MAG TPA: SemiSWEET family transporter [Candidatus Moranbacteria bacterium]|mgnify:CR=1 FL=1|nr:SemiSWEET family transporter [Candidatus Moranbacteria bacterium]
MIIPIVGYLAGATTAIAILPQVIKSWKTKSTKDISLLWTLIYLFSMLLWVTYGFLLKEIPMIVTLSIETFLYIILLVLKIRHG